MKILLTRPDNITPMLIPNIGLGYLATALRREDHDVDIVDCIRDHMNPERFTEYLARHNVDAVGFQVYTFDLPVLKPYLKACRAFNPNMLLLAGGPHPSAVPEEMLATFPELDVLFCGEAECGMPAFCTLIDRDHGLPFQPARTTDEQLATFPGLVWRKSDGSVARNPPEMVKDLDAAGFPAWDLIRPDTYPPAPQGTFTRRLPVAPIIVTRGCPFDCTFCAGHVIAGKKLRFRSASNVVDEIELLVKTYGIREIHVEDDNFSLHKKRVIELCTEILTRKIDITWACPNGLRLDSLDEEVIAIMEQAGCYSIAVGIESGSQRILDDMKKKLDRSQVREKIAMIRRSSDMRITGFFMLGYPGETRQEMKETIRFSLDLDIDKVNFGAFMPLPGTEMFYRLRDNGDLVDLDYSRLTEYRVSIATGEVTPGELRRLLQCAFVRFYLRPRIILRFISEIRSFYQLKVLMKRFLEVFWR